MSIPVDTLSRHLRDLRISVTDRCNFRCTYCMPKDVYGKDYPYLPQPHLLKFEEIYRLGRLFVHLGIKKIRLTGGEPLLRKNIEHLIAQLATLRMPSGNTPDLALTTNGSLLSRKAPVLRRAGLQRLTVSLDALDDRVFRQMNDVDFPVQEVLDGLKAAENAGFLGTKVNMVVKRGTNHQEIIPMARQFLGTGIVLRFIEYMDVGNANGWRMQEVMPSRDVLQRLSEVFEISPIQAQKEGETASRYCIFDATSGLRSEIGLISSVTQAFCKTCTRARLSTEGKLYLCLFASKGYDLRSLLRSDASDEALLADITSIWEQRNDQYSALRGSGLAPREKRIEMSYIGG